MLKNQVFPAMALKTNINPNENLVYNGEFSNLVENGQILLLNEPLMIYTPENIESDCAIVLDPLNNNANNENLNLPELIFDGNYFQFENLQNGNLQNDYGLHENLQFINERQQVDDGLAVLEILCNNKSNLDQPEFIDINKLSEVDHFDNPKSVDVLCISDDDDVVFVREYIEDKCNKKAVKKIEDVPDKTVESDVSQITDNGIRRNPIRKARINSKKLSREHILEEDFALLDTSDEEKKESDKENKIPNKKSPPPVETLKQWPVNAHERPEYNTETKKIEAFDYTIREIQKKVPNKKPRLETVPVRRKSKKKYFTRKRRPRVIEPKKIPISELKPLVNSTTELLKDFVGRYKESKDLIKPENRNSGMCSNENIFNILKNQMILFSVVNDLNQDDVLKKLDQNNFNESETKE